MGVVGVDSVVVEGWSSCFVVGLLLVLGQGGNFGELILAQLDCLAIRAGSSGSSVLSRATNPASGVVVRLIFRGVFLQVV